MIAAANFTDPGNARVILLAAAGLVALAVVLTVGTVWWWRTSKVEHPALGPLEVMSSRRWQRSAGTGELPVVPRASGPEDAAVRSAAGRAVEPIDDAEPDTVPSEAEVEVVRDLDHYDDAGAVNPVLFDQDVHDVSGALPAMGAPVDPLLAPRPPQ